MTGNVDAVVGDGSGISTVRCSGGSPATASQRRDAGRRGEDDGDDVVVGRGSGRRRGAAGTASGAGEMR